MNTIYILIELDLHPALVRRGKFPVEYEQELEDDNAGKRSGVTNKKYMIPSRSVIML
jgi:hypothetical protein